MNFFSLFKRSIIYHFKKKIPIDNELLNLKSLDDFFHHYGSDKANIFKKNNSEGHGFSEFYEKEFKYLKDKKINILEIGSYAGASAASFTKYFKNSTVFCFDINISKFEYISERINVFGLDINNKKKKEIFLRKISKKYKIDHFDIIIDDGSHNLSDIIYTFNFLFKYLKKNGIFVIEDFMHPNYYEYNNNVEHIFVNDFLKNLSNRLYSVSSIVSKKDQSYLIDAIEKIDFYNGNLADSNICFIKKN